MTESPRNGQPKARPAPAPYERPFEPYDLERWVAEKLGMIFAGALLLGLFMCFVAVFDVYHDFKLPLLLVAVGVVGMFPATAWEGRLDRLTREYRERSPATATAPAPAKPVTRPRPDPARAAREAQRKAEIMEAWLASDEAYKRSKAQSPSKKFSDGER